jgi:anti-anti-sigma regulatory factor
MSPSSMPSADFLGEGSGPAPRHWSGALVAASNEKLRMDLGDVSYIDSSRGRGNFVYSFTTVTTSQQGQFKLAQT